jgi:hypothetical protein
VLETPEPHLQRSADGRGQPARVPVEPEQAAERLQPVRIGQPADDVVGPGILAHGEHEGARELRHPLEQPRRRTPIVEREIGSAGAMHHPNGTALGNSGAAGRAGGVLVADFEPVLGVEVGQAERGFAGRVAAEVWDDRPEDPGVHGAPACDELPAAAGVSAV